MGRRAEQGRTEQRRAELIEVTAREIARVGLERVTLRDIARAGGWTTGIVSHYFVDKRELMIATFRSRADRARERIDAAVSAGVAALPAIVEAALPLDAERVASWKVWLAFWGVAIGDDELSAIQLERHRTFKAAIEAAFRAEQDAGRFGGADAGREALRLVAVLDGIALQAIFEPERWPAEEQLAMVGAHLAQLEPAPSDA
jgi:AcrR family transcriptional regulator